MRWLSTRADKWFDIIFLVRVPLALLVMLIFAAPLGVRSDLFRNTFLLAELTDYWQLVPQLTLLTFACTIAAAIALLEMRVIYANYYSRFFDNEDGLRLVATSLRCGACSKNPCECPKPPPETYQLPQLGSHWSWLLWALWIGASLSIPWETLRLTYLTSSVSLNDDRITTWYFWCLILIPPITFFFSYCLLGWVSRTSKRIWPRAYLVYSAFLPWDSDATTAELLPQTPNMAWLRHKILSGIRSSLLPYQGLLVSTDIDAAPNGLPAKAQDLHLAPGHRVLCMSFVVLIATYVIGAVITYFEPISSWLCPAFFLVLVSTLLASVIGLLAFFLDRYRFPVAIAVAGWMFFCYAVMTTLWGLGVLVLLQVGVLIWVSIIRGRTVRVLWFLPALSVLAIVVPIDRVHRFETPEVTDPSKVEWAETKSGNSKDRRKVYVVVTAPGGGIHAAAWTARVMTGLREELGADFIQSISHISAVSGGSIGTLFVLDRWDELVSKKLTEKEIQTVCQTINTNAQTSSLESVGYGVAYQEVVWSLWPLWHGTSDGGRLQERFWRSLLQDAHRRDTLRDWGHKPNFPTVVFNATEVETGSRIMFATRKIRVDGAGQGEGSGKNVLQVLGNKYDVPVVAAARMSATFPYVTPVAEPACNANRAVERNLGFIADGGYADNEGITTAIESIKQIVRQHSDERPRVLLVRIVHQESSDDKLTQPSNIDRFFRPTIGPFETMFNTRIASQAEHAELDVEGLARLMPAGNFRSVKVVFHGQKMVLSWKLTKNERQAYDAKWNIEKAHVLKQINEFGKW